jgi:3-hydroxyisobutyrate dehydrogenase-like beta-hydroxyacid dehydrogenase
VDDGKKRALEKAAVSGFGAMGVSMAIKRLEARSKVDVCSAKRRNNWMPFVKSEDVTLIRRQVTGE